MSRSLASCLVQLSLPKILKTNIVLLFFCFLFFPTSHDLQYGQAHTYLHLQFFNNFNFDFINLFSRLIYISYFGTALWVSPF